MKSVPEKLVDAAVLRNGLNKLGPGLITGAADDVPSGMATNSQAGAQFGFSLLHQRPRALHPRHVLWRGPSHPHHA